MGIEIALIFTIILCGSVMGSLKKSDLWLERCAIIYFDPKYIVNSVTFTSRSKRGDTYKTNITTTMIHAWGSNVTAMIYYKNAANNVEHILMTAQICEALKLDWIRKFIEKYSDIPPSCDVPPGEYHVINMELKQQDFPLYSSLPSGEHYIGLMFVLTKTRHVMLNMKGTVHVRN